MTTRIYDPVAGKHRDVEDIHVVHYEEKTVVEFTVVGGPRGPWPLCMDLTTFRTCNPDIAIEE